LLGYDTVIIKGCYQRLGPPNIDPRVHESSVPSLSLNAPQI
jgi:hypothetical protein